VYSEKVIPPESVLKVIYVEPKREVYQDPAYGFRMLVDIALQAPSPAVNAPTTAHQVILRLTNLLSLITKHPQNPGVYADEDFHVRLIHSVSTWEEFVALSFDEIRYYGKDDPQTKKSLKAALYYLLGNVPEVYKSPLERQKEFLIKERKPA